VTIPPSAPRVAACLGDVLTRRRAVTTGALGGLLLLSGCTGGGADREPDPSPTPRPPDRDPDLALVAEALRREQAAVALLVGTRRRHGSVRGALAPALQIHRAHVELLTGATDGGALVPAPRPAVSGPLADLLGRLVRSERSLVERHTATAVAARSGTLARVLAGMAAAAAQQAVLLEELRSSRGRQAADGAALP
jgi:hypothetical protein